MSSKASKQRDSWGENDYHPSESDEEEEALDASSSSDDDASEHSDSGSSDEEEQAVSAAPPRQRLSRKCTSKTMDRYQDDNFQGLMLADIHEDELEAALEEPVSSEYTVSSETTEGGTGHQDLANCEGCPTAAAMEELAEGPPDAAAEDYEIKLDLWVQAQEAYRDWSDGCWDEADTGMFYYGLPRGYAFK